MILSSSNQKVLKQFIKINFFIFLIVNTGNFAQLGYQIFGGKVLIPSDYGILASTNSLIGILALPLAIIFNFAVRVLIQKKTSHLTFYIKSQRSKLLKSLIAYGSDLNFRDNTGMTPMMHAIENVNIDAVNILLESDIEMDLTDYSGKTIFDYAKNSRNNYLRKLIISTDKNF